MIILHRPLQLRQILGEHAADDQTIGFVPTMGALHKGHIALVNRSKKDTGLTVCSIFVNPTQFNDPSDYNKYPSRIHEDILALEHAGTDILFLPDVGDMYTQGTTGLETYDLGYLENILEGKYRPGHFQGVCQVMSRLLKIVEPNLLFMGQKDYQQCMVIQKLIMTLGMDIRFVTHPTVRENDGLAMSSRNLRLSPENRKNASAIYQSLMDLKGKLVVGDLRELKTDASKFLSSRGFKVDYFEIADARTLHVMDTWNGEDPLVALVAAFLGEVRLIDNMLLNR